MLAAVSHGNAPAPRFCLRRNRSLREPGKPLAQRIKIDLHGIIMHQQRSIGWYGLGHAGDGFARKRSIERQHPLVCGIIDVAAEFHRDGAVAARQNPGRGDCRCHGLTSPHRISSSSVFSGEAEFASRK